MSRPARILILGESSSRDAMLKDKLRSYGFDSANIPGDQASEHINFDTSPDLVILNMRQKETAANAGRFAQVAKELKALGRNSRLPVILMGEQNRQHRQSACEAVRAGDIDDVILGPVNEAQICGRIQSMIRLKTMQDELVRRLATARSYGADAPASTTPPKQISGARILVVGPSMHFSEIENSMAPDTVLQGALTPAIAMDYLQARAIDTVIVDVTSSSHEALDFIKSVRQNPQLYNTPVIFLACENQSDEMQQAYELGVTDILFKPFSTAQMGARIISLVREARFRDAMKAVYARARHMVTSDALSGLYNRGFLLTHCQSLIRDGAAHGRVFTALSFRVANMQDINTRHGYTAGDRVLRQIGEAIGLLTRGEDLAARHSGAVFVVLLPNTSLEEANIAMQRIRSVINCTPFSISELSEPVKVTLDCGMAELQCDDSAESLLKRAMS